MMGKEALKQLLESLHRLSLLSKLYWLFTTFCSLWFSSLSQKYAHVHLSGFQKSFKCIVESVTNQSLSHKSTHCKLAMFWGFSVTDLTD